MDVQFSWRRQVVIYYQRHLLDIQSPSPDICGDEHSAVAGPELGHDLISFLLGHFAVHAANCEVGLSHFGSEPLDLLARVAKNDGLSNGEGVVKVAESVEFPLLFVDLDEELLDAFEGELVSLDEYSNRIFHELLGEF